MDFPPIKEHYEDEFGIIDLEVYEMGRTVWNKQAKHFAQCYLNDPNEGSRLMMKAICEVSSFQAENPTQIKNLNAYLFKAFKNLLFANTKKTKRQKEILNGFAYKDGINEESKLLQRIEVYEIIEKFNEWEKQIFQLHYIFEYTYEEIAPKFDMKSNFLRKKMSQALRRVRKEIKEESQ